ncbi:MAG TPA: hypothetical protein VHE54_15905 [Puia sp.]|nr:hypothetical protein [Puia sp.]
MENGLKAGRWCFAICLVGLAGQQFYYGDFRPVFVPAWPAPMTGQILPVYLFSLFLILAAIALVSEIFARTAMLLLAWLFLALVLFCHLPFHLLRDPDAGNIGVWNNALKELCFSGCALIMAGSFPPVPEMSPKQAAFEKPLETLIPLGAPFFSIMLIIFGIEHFLYADFVRSLVPGWIPAPLFWTYFAAVALIGAGAGIILRIRVKRIAMLTAIMIFLWFLILHIPRAAVAPVTDNGNELTSVFESLGFSGAAFVLSWAYPFRPRLSALT